MDSSLKATIVTYADEFSKREALELSKAAGYSVQAVIGLHHIVRSEFGVGEGKAEELAETVSENGSKLLIIDESLTSAQANNLAKATRVEVIDRERLILNIFALRAATTQAKLQVQLAELRYELPRTKDSVRNSVAGERAGFMGIGELTVDVKFKALRRRMVTVKEKLARAEMSRSLQRKERLKLGEPLVSLAGYTSSGKTTLFNRLASESKEESPNLFTTLSTTTRAISFPGAGRRIILSDTVGFISRLPTYLVESFRSTLDELTYADLILLVVDASESPESMSVKLGSCTEILQQLAVDPKKILLVLNKVDLLPPGAWSESKPLLEGYDSVRVSATRGDGLKRLRNQILERTREAHLRMSDGRRRREFGTVS